MADVIVNHPDAWIGVPETWPNEGWPAPEAWAPALVDELAENWGEPHAQKREVVTRILVELAYLAQKRGSRAYLSLGGWAGELTIAHLATIPSEVLSETTVAELASAQQEATEKPIVETFVTDSGLEGWATTRYAPGSESPGLIARLDYLWSIPDGGLWLTSSNSDLVAFERSRPLVDDLARTIRLLRSADVPEPPPGAHVNDERTERSPRVTGSRMMTSFLKWMRR